MSCEEFGSLESATRWDMPKALRARENSVIFWIRWVKYSGRSNGGSYPKKC